MTVQIHLRRTIRRISDESLLDMKGAIEHEIKRRLDNDNNNVTKVVRGT